MTQYVITANLVREGTVVFLSETPAGRAWAADIADATVHDGKDAADAALGRAEADVAANRVVGTYRFEVEATGGVPLPVTARERIRAAHEPTVEYGR